MTTKTDKDTTATKKPAVKKAPVKKTAAAKPAAAKAASAKPASTKPVAKKSAAKADAVIRSKKTKAENKAIFAPLGKYALVGAIMVTLIVTTAIMLDKQLGNVEQEVAAIETDINKISYTTAAVETESATQEVSAVTQAPATVATAPAETYIAETPDAKILTQTTTQEVKAESAITQPIAQPTAQQVAQVTDSRSTMDAAAASEEMKVRHKNMAAEMAAENEARIEASKLEQKQKMSEMFARIKKLEGKQLDRYKTGQDKQIESLRAQITRQQQQIERLEKRNKEIYEMRAANMQRNQVRREEALNRI